MATVNSITKAVKVKLTGGRIADFKSDEGKAQSFLWCTEPKSGSTLMFNPSIRPLCGLLRANGLFTNMVTAKNTVRAEPVEACPEPVEVV